MTKLNHIFIIENHISEEAEILLDEMCKKFIEEGYLNNGAIFGERIKKQHRKLYLELIDNGYVVRRNCMLEGYELSEFVRNKLVREYELMIKWGDNAYMYRVFMPKQ